MEQKYNIFLDDCRNTPEGWLRTFTVEETIELLLKLEGKIGILSLDNDLGEGLKEGYKVMEWLEEYYFTNGYQLPDKIQVHSMNPIATKQMNVIIDKLYGDKNGKV